MLGDHMYDSSFIYVDAFRNALIIIGILSGIPVDILKTTDALVHEYS